VGRKPSPALIGAFVIGAVVLAVVTVVILGSGRLFRKTYPYVVFFTGSVNGLRVGAPVKFKGVEVGAVKDIRLNLADQEQNWEDIRIPVIIELDEEHIRQRGGTVDLRDRERLASMIAAGLRAQLASESIVTGVLYVSLDIFPGTPVRLVADPHVPYTEIPTVPTPLEEARATLSRLVTRIQQIDIERLVGSLQETVDGLKRITNSPGVQHAADSLDETVHTLNEAAASVRTLANNLDRTLPASLRTTSENASTALREAQGALGGVRTLVDPEGPLAFRIARTLDDLSGAARAVRDLAEYLDRNPSAVVRGRPVSEDGK
jgi:phospholipid/cholesterol/gamma-HCH transport system substrate-binding protein